MLGVVKSGHPLKLTSPYPRSSARITTILGGGTGSWARISVTSSNQAITNARPRSVFITLAKSGGSTVAYSRQLVKCDRSKQKARWRRRGANLTVSRGGRITHRKIVSACACDKNLTLGINCIRFNKYKPVKNRCRIV